MIGKKKIQTKKTISKKTADKEIVIKKVNKVALKAESKINKEIDRFSNELDAFLNKSKGINVASLAKREQAPYFFDTGNYALNWVISDDFFKGLPGTKAIVVAGECIGANTPLKIKASEEFIQFLKKEHNLS